MGPVPITTLKRLSYKVAQLVDEGMGVWLSNLLYAEVGGGSRQDLLAARAH